MNIRIKFLQFRLWLGLDSGARQAKHRLNQTRKQMRRNAILIKATKYQADTAPPIMNECDGETVFQLSTRTPDAATTDGIAVYDPTDSETAELMRRFEFGDAGQRDHEDIFGNQVDTTAPAEIEWEGDTLDPFRGVRNLG